MANAIEDVINTLSEDELDLLDSDPQMLSAFKTKYAAPPAAPTQPEPSFGNQMLGAAKENVNRLTKLGQGAMEGATFNTTSVDDRGNVIAMEPEPAKIPGSIMSVKGTANKSFGDKYSGWKGAGRMAGSVVPMVASELLAGAMAPSLVLKYGMGPVQAAMNQMGLTMATYAGMRGAVQNKPPSETVGEMATGYMAGVPLGAASYGANKAIDMLSKDTSEGLANQYLNTPPKVADSLADKGKPSLGRQYLDKTKYGAGTSKKQQFDDIRLRLEHNRMMIKDKFQRADELARTPNNQDVPVSGIPQLEYKPGTTQELNPQDLSSQFKHTGTLPSGASGGLKGERILLGDKIKTTQPGGEKYQTLMPGTQVAGDYSGVSSAPTKPRSNFKETVGSLKPDEPYRAVSGTKKGPYIDLDEIRAAAGPVREEQADIGAKGAANSIDDLMGEAGIAPGEKEVTNERAFELLTRLDAEVNKAHQALDPNTITPATEARAKMANLLRDMLRRNVPEAAKLLGENHSLQLFEASLLPQISGRAPVQRFGGVIDGAIAGALRSRAGLGLARGMDAITKEGTISNIALESAIKPSAGTVGRLGLADYIKRKEQKRVK